MIARRASRCASSVLGALEALDSHGSVAAAGLPSVLFAFWLSGLQRELEPVAGGGLVASSLRGRCCRLSCESIQDMKLGWQTR